MGRAKRSRKIRSGNKMVRIALRKQAALHSFQMAATVAMFQATIGAMQAQRMKKGGASSEDILRVCQEEVVLPLAELTRKVDV
jgi:hypothetical protein